MILLKVSQRPRSHKRSDDKLVVLAQRALNVLFSGIYFVNVRNGQIELIEPVDETCSITKGPKANPLGGQHHIHSEMEDHLTDKGATRIFAARLWALKCLWHLFRKH